MRNFFFCSFIFLGFSALSNAMETKEPKTACDVYYELLQEPAICYDQHTNTFNKYELKRAKYACESNMIVSQYKPDGKSTFIRPESQNK